MSLRCNLIGLAALILGCGPAGIASGSGSAGTGAAGGDRGSSGGSGPGETSPGSNSDAGSPGSLDGPSCGVKTFGLAKVPPDLLLVLDRSGSMRDLPDGTTCSRSMQATCGSMAKWPQMTAAIQQVVMQTDSAIRWGLAFFPDSGACGFSGTPDVPIADSNAGPIAAAIAARRASGATPTSAAINGASAYLLGLSDLNPKFILLATDGLPNCLGGDNAASDANGAIQAVKVSAGMGVPVFVIGIGSLPDADATLTAMAIAGGKPQAADPRYYPVSSTAQLASVLQTIGTLVGSCSFGLGMKPPDPENINIVGGGAKIPKDTTHTNGWDYGTGQTTVTLFGNWCAEVMAGRLMDIEAVFGCPGVVIK